MFAATQIKTFGKRRVLDVACGVAYGAQYLAKSGAESVVAVDNDPGALRIAAEQFSAPTIVLCQDDCHTLDACRKYGPFDAVVSFETLEHLSQPLDFLKRCRELLNPQGVMIISTPNLLVRNAAEPKWEYHEREYKASEFETMLVEAGFREVSLYGQRLTPLGKFRKDIRAEINKLRSNPFARLGRWLQKLIRGHRDGGVALPEQLDDFEIVPLGSARECDTLLTEGPFVLICLARP